MRIGLISDTHGLLRPEALDVLAGVAAIVHAGDICEGSVLERLRQIAPVTAVRGNNDRGPWADDLPVFNRLQAEDVTVLVVHDLADLRRQPAEARGANVVVSGHSHRPVIEWRGGVLYVNPGSAGPRRFKLPITIAYLTITQGSALAEIRTLL